MAKLPRKPAESDAHQPDPVRRRSQRQRQTAALPSPSLAVLLWHDDTKTISSEDYSTTGNRNTMDDYDEDENKQIELISKDGKSFIIPEKAARVSVLLSDMPREEDSDTTKVEITRVMSDCLEKVVDFMKHYAEEEMKEIPTPLGGSSFEEVMDQTWYQNFVSDDNLSRDMLFDLLTAANFMGIKPLLDLTCLKVTFQITGKNAEQIREILRLPELTPEEEAQAREDHKWIFEDS